MSDGMFALDKIVYVEDWHTKSDETSLSHNQQQAAQSHMKNKGGEFLVGKEFDDLMHHIINVMTPETYIKTFGKLKEIKYNGI